jgi:hypothetical protein
VNLGEKLPYPPSLSPHHQRSRAASAAHHAAASPILFGSGVASCCFASNVSTRFLRNQVSFCFARMFRLIGSSVDGCIAAGAEATKACVREIFRHCSQITGAVSAFTLDLVHSRGYYAGQATRFNGRAHRQDSPPPPSASTFRGVVNKSSSGTRSRFHVRLLKRFFALLWSLAHVLFSLFLPRTIFVRFMGNAGRVTTGARLRRAPSELNFQSPSPASTGFFEDLCVHILSFIDRAGAFLRRPVRYIFGLNVNKSAASAASAAALSTSLTAASEGQTANSADQPQAPDSDLSARFGLSVSSIVCKAG